MSENKTNLKVEIRSFALMHAGNHDKLNGPTNFMFDCRAVTNPGRIDCYKPLSGLDLEVKDFFVKQSTAHDFFDHLKPLLLPSIENARVRNFPLYKIWFGCTGGQHRSVYFAQKTAAWLGEFDDLIIDIVHLDIDARYSAK